MFILTGGSFECVLSNNHDQYFQMPSKSTERARENQLSSLYGELPSFPGIFYPRPSSQAQHRKLSLVKLTLTYATGKTTCLKMFGPAWFSVGHALRCVC